MGMSRDCGPTELLTVRVQLLDSEPEIWRLLALAEFLTLGSVRGVLHACIRLGERAPHKVHGNRAVRRGSRLTVTRRNARRGYPRTIARNWETGRRRTDPWTSCSYDCSTWLHRLELMTRRPVEPSAPPSWLLDEARRGPLEDAGGLPGYEEIMDVLADTAQPKQDEYSACGRQCTSQPSAR